MRIGTVRSLHRYPVKSKLGMYASVTRAGMLREGAVVELLPA